MSRTSGNAALKLMSDTKYYLDYSQWKEEEVRYERWPDSCDRTFGMHRKKYASKMTPELEALMNEAEEAYIDKYYLTSQRSLQFGGEPILKHEVKIYNCFGIETRFVTINGMKSFADFKDGSETTVLTHTGSWKRAKVKNYGKQSLNTVKFIKNTGHKNVRVTGNHRWILNDGKSTTELKVGDRLYKEPSIFQEFDFESSSIEEQLYWCYGFVYGDGVVNNNYSMARLCGKKRDFETRFTNLGFKSSSSLSLEGDVMVYTGHYQKTLPIPELTSPSLMRAFIAGYLDADGAKNTNASGSKFNGIQTSDSETAKFIRDNFPIAGVNIVSSKDINGHETNFGKHENSVYFRTSDSSGSKFNSGWKVESIFENTSFEDVWCLEVEDDHSFILEGGLVTGNCAASYADRPRFFGEVFYNLLGGCGTGFSVQKHHVKKLPPILPIDELDKVIHVVEDSIEGWADAKSALLSSYFERGTKFPEYRGKYVEFDYSQVREEGAYISGGFKAPGPEPLRKAIEQARALLENALITNLRVVGEHGVKLRPIQVYDLVMFASDAVLSGGVRRAATLCMFSNDDEEMLSAKSEENWSVKYPWRQRSNNSAVYLRSELTKAKWDELKEHIRKYGEPGIILVDSLEQLFNPCVEIGLYGYILPPEEFELIKTAENEFSNSGWQFCNLVELNGGITVSQEIFLKQCKVGAIAGTLQAGYTNFKYLTEATKIITEREALLGIGLTGWMQNPDVLLDKDLLAAGIKIIKETNETVAAMIGINPAARLTTVKPSGNASTLLMTYSGIHGAHSKRYFRSMEVNSTSEIAKAFQKTNPFMCKRSAKSSNGKDFTITFPIEYTNENGLYNKDLLGVKLLEKVAFVQEHWIRAGKIAERCIQPYLTHNVSNTVTVDDWDEVGNFIYDHKDCFCGLSFMSLSGDKTYEDAPFQEVPYPEEVAAKYGTAAYFASGLIVDALHVFPDGLWKAINYAKHWYDHYEVKRTNIINKIVENAENENAVEFIESLDDLSLQFNDDDIDPFFNNKQRVDWKRRFVKFADNYFKGDLVKCGECLLDVNNLHRWDRMVREMNYTDIGTYLTKPVYKDVSTTGGMACSGGQCDIQW